MKSYRIESGTAQLAADERGAGPGMVILHAGVADRRGYAQLATALSPGFRTVTYDRRGFGETTYAPQSYSHVDDLIAVLDHCALDDAILVGNSQGGRIAIDTALAHPTRVRALVLIAPAVSGEIEPASYAPSVEALGDAIDRAEAAGDLDAMNELEAQLWLDGPGQPAGRVGGATRALFLAMNGIALRAAPTGDEADPGDAMSRLHDIAVPTLVLCGDCDLPSMVVQSERVAGAVARGSFRIVAGTAHLPHLEQLDAVVAHVREFAGSIVST